MNGSTSATDCFSSQDYDTSYSRQQGHVFSLALDTGRRALGFDI
jgi:hypothetical protein